MLPPFISVVYSVFGWWGGTFVSFCYSRTHTRTHTHTDPHTHTRLCGHSETSVWQKSLALYPLMREFTWQWESPFICVWNANVSSRSLTLCRRASLRASRCRKSHLLCVFWHVWNDEHSTVLQIEFRQRKVSAVGPKNIFAFSIHPASVSVSFISPRIRTSDSSLH